ncbi:MAG: RecB family exonuclease [Candidatus Thorarchaeota archaeon]|jgi:CRISPR/Cas system-associated exonuclease Cas4 (RecB family)
MVELEKWYYKYLGWSFTKHRLWGLCKRAYYYRYIGTAMKESDDFDISKLKRLKSLDSKFVLQGKLIHDILENQIGQHYLGRGLNEDGAKTQYVQLLERYRSTARDTLTEFFNGGAIDDRFFDDCRANGIDQLSMFFGVIWPQLKDLEYEKHEKFDKFPVDDVEVIVKVDFVSRTKDGKIVVSDWKTGSDKEEYESDLQIGAYVIWAANEYEVPIDDIRAELIYLRTGTMRPRKMSPEVLEDIKKLVVDEFAEMNESLEIESFPANPSHRKCVSCQFATVCPESILEAPEDIGPKEEVGPR